MADYSQIYDFAVKWCAIFRNQDISCVELVNQNMAEDCAALGFYIDSGNAFYERYGAAAHDSDALNRILDHVKDINLLGSAIYARWIHFNQSADSVEDILAFNNRSWFILALGRLAQLTGKNPFVPVANSVKQDRVVRISVDYHRITKIVPSVPVSDERDFVTWDYSERLIIDRKSECIEHICSVGTGCTVSHKYVVEDGISSLLEDICKDNLFDNIVGNPPDAVDTPNETRDYTITVDYEETPQRILRGTYDKNGLPDDFERFAETVFGFMRFYGLGEILDPSVYRKAKRHKDEYIYCSVVFEDGYKSYYYITDDDSIVIGDFVLVPAGSDNHTAIVEIVDIEYFRENDAPYPVDKTKRVFRKCTDDDFDEFDPVDI